MGGRSRTRVAGHAPRATRPCHVAVEANDELDRRRLRRVLERGGFDVLPHGRHFDRTPDVTVRIGEPCDEPPVSNVPLVVVTRSSDHATIAAALDAGASGAVADSDVESRLAATVWAVSVGQLSIPAEHRTAVTGPFLSAREKQVMAMVVLGFTNIEIATKLHITEPTVKSHLSSTYRKLRVRSRQEATALVLSNPDLGLGILTLAGERPRRSRRAE